MKFTQKLKKLGQPLTYKRARQRIQRWLHPIPLRPLLAQIDRYRLRSIQQKYASSSEFETKYLDVPAQLKLNIRRVQERGLHLSQPKGVLDLGSGGGFFLFILKQLGHDGLGLDIDQSPIFAELTELLGVRRKIWTITAFQPLPDLGQKFDWVTAYSTAFHGAGSQPWRWHAQEWAFFLDDLGSHLEPEGQIFFQLNPAYAGAYYTPEILDLFLSRGAIVERENVRFPPR